MAIHVTCADIAQVACLELGSHHASLCHAVSHEARQGSEWLEIERLNARATTQYMIAKCAPAHFPGYVYKVLAGFANRRQRDYN